MFQSLDDDNLDEATREWLKSMPDNKVFEWLGVDSQGVPKYLYLLNLSWKEKEIDKNLQSFNDIAKRLAEEHDYLRQMIRTEFWRHTLVGCTAVILLETKLFCADLAESFRQPNFVSPQIAVALGLLCPNEAVTLLSEIIRKADYTPQPENWKRDFAIYTSPKAITAAQVVLSKIKPDLVAELSRAEVFQYHKNHPDGQIGADVAEHHWQFWSDYLKRRSSSGNKNGFYNKFRGFFKIKK